MSKQFSLLKTRRFLPLFMTQFLGAFNDNLFKNALIILITYQFSHLIHMKSSELTAIAAGIFIVPYFLFSAMAGQLADKFERSNLVRYTKLVEIALALIAILGFYLQNVDLLLFVLFLLGTQSTFFGPLKYALLPDLLKKKELIAANGLVGAGTFFAILLGTTIGGVSITLHHGELSISLLMLSIAFLGWVVSCYIPKVAGPNPRLKINYNIFSETLEVVNFTRQHKRLFATILAISWFWMLGSVLLAELAPLVKHELFADESVVTLFFVIFSIGVGLGSLLCNSFLKGKVETKYVSYAMFAMSLFIFDFCFGALTFPQGAGTLRPLHIFIQYWQGIKMCIDLLFIAMSSGLYIVPLYASLQYDTPEKHRARVIGSNNIVNALMMVIGAVVSATLLALGGTVSLLFLLIAIGNIVVGLLLRKLKKLRN